MSGTFLGINVTDPTFVPVTAWLGHGPFASWLIRASEPTRLVELGTHTGYSYFSFCQAVVAENLKTECFAVDTWQGDEHAGFYDDSVFNTVSAENAKYAKFSRLIRKTFFDALNDIDNGSVDILHIDGRHFYDDVKEDFENWMPKLSTRAIVIFHDTEVHERGFGVWRYWAEISKTRPSFNFAHQHGLGVIFWGSEIPRGLTPLLDLLALPEGRQATLEFFALQGDSLAYQRRAFQHDLETVEEIEKLSEQLVASELQVNELSEQLIASELQVNELSEQLAASELQVKDFYAQVHQIEAKLQKLQILLQDARTRPLRVLKGKLIFNILQIISNSRLPLPTSTAERLLISAKKRDPSRQDLG